MGREGLGLGSTRTPTPRRRFRLGLNPTLEPKVRTRVEPEVQPEFEPRIRPQGCCFCSPPPPPWRGGRGRVVRTQVQPNLRRTSLAGWAWAELGWSRAGAGLESAGLGWAARYNPGSTQVRTRFKPAGSCASLQLSAFSTSAFPHAKRESHTKTLGGFKTQINLNLPSSQN